MKVVKFWSFLSNINPCINLTSVALCSILVGDVSRKNNRDEIVGVFIWAKVWRKNSPSQSDGGVTGRGCVRVEKQAVEASSMYVREKRQFVGSRKGSHGMVEIKLLCFRWLSSFWSTGGPCPPQLILYSDTPPSHPPLQRIGLGYFWAEPFPV